MQTLLVWGHTYNDLFVYRNLSNGGKRGLHNFGNVDIDIDIDVGNKDIV